MNYKVCVYYFLYLLNLIIHAFIKTWKAKNQFLHQKRKQNKNKSPKSQKDCV